jgi:hypothetical protein
MSLVIAMGVAIVAAMLLAHGVNHWVHTVKHRH